MIFLLMYPCQHLREFSGWVVRSTHSITNMWWFELLLCLTVRFHSLGWIRIGHLPHSGGLGNNELARMGMRVWHPMLNYPLDVRAWSSHQKYFFKSYSFISSLYMKTLLLLSIQLQQAKLYKNVKNTFDNKITVRKVTYIELEGITRFQEKKASLYRLHDR